ncbi:aminomethyltransferase beta-barrel domain-containing protein, partial [Thiococcus pfennigii]|uniref:aminomethyltransferase beta-barrel domain-containing protein n=1 Tax=Thiococcus pfennigii TaxID=1057 RepID=UPI0030B8BA55|nr:tRNA 2-thiouridine(34) synthase MnmA [Thiococcus pfennigii]
PGPIETPDGRVVGEHQGIAYYTIGQRQGLGIGGLAGGGEAPWFVAGKDLARNALIVVQGGDHPLLMSREVEGTQLHWIAGHPPGPPPYRCRARLRHRQPLQDCLLLSYDDSACRVTFDHPQRAVTPGQAIVLYRHDECLGGAVIAQAS